MTTSGDVARRAQLVCWATAPARTTVQKPGVDHSRAHVGVSKKLSRGSDVVPGLQEMRRK